MNIELMKARAEMLVDPDWLAERLRAPRVRVVDCSATLISQPVGASLVLSGRAGWIREHIPGATFFDLKEDLSAPVGHLAYNLPSEAHMSRLLSEAGIERDTTVVLYGVDSPSSVTRAWWVLSASGVVDVRILDGGFKHWLAKGLPTTAAVEPPTPSDFKARLQPALIADLEDVKHMVSDGEGVLVNALSPRMFAGTADSHYGRPGRIPGSVNVPTSSLFQPDGRLRDLNELRQIFADAGVLDSESVVAYCGGGIAASATVFALTLLGHPNARLYDRSLLEWSNLPELPMDVG